MYIIKPKVFYLVTSLPIHLKGRMTCCANYHFNETIFSSLGDNSRRTAWNYALILTYLNPCTNQCELKVQKIIYFQELANELPNVFIDAKKVTKSFLLI